ncbi:MAG TPA: hypothetical protein VJI75_05090 [Candidatus Nanoarchaeia archaeon]|nr:hypothetical protein [Candidatus Nanoarchaeia archaeon]
MIIYNPHNERLLNERMKEAEELLSQIPARYCFITGSFLYRERYEDIDVFVITRSKKTIALKNKKAKITLIDFNDLYSLFYHSISKSCVAKNLLPSRPLKVTISDYWQVINEAIPTLLNQKEEFYKNARFLVLYTEYLKNDEVLDTFQLNDKVNSFRDYKEVIGYIDSELPIIMNKHAKPSYIKRFFYTQAGYYKKLREYKSQDFLYELTHKIARGIMHG